MLEDYCRQYPALGPPDQLADELIVAEYQARHRWGDKPTHAEYRTRFLGKANDLDEKLVQADEALTAEIPVPAHDDTFLIMLSRTLE